MNATDTQVAYSYSSSVDKFILLSPYLPELLVQANDILHAISALGVCEESNFPELELFAQLCTIC